MSGYVQIHCAFVPEAQLYYDPNSTYFFTLDYKKCPESSSLERQSNSQTMSNHVKPCQTLWTAWNSRRLVTKVRAIQKNPIQSRWNRCWLPCGSGTLSMIQRYNSCASWIRRCTCERALLSDVVCTLYTWLQDHAIKFVGNCYFLVRRANLARGRKFRVEKPDPCHPRLSTSYRPTELEVWNTTERSFILLNSCNSLREFSTCKC